MKKWLGFRNLMCGYCFLLAFQVQGEPKSTHSRIDSKRQGHAKTSMKSTQQTNGKITENLIVSESTPGSQEKLGENEKNLEKPKPVGPVSSPENNKLVEGVKENQKPEIFEAEKKDEQLEFLKDRESCENEEKLLPKFGEKSNSIQVPKDLEKNKPTQQEEDPLDSLVEVHHVSTHTFLVTLPKRLQESLFCPKSLQFLQQEQVYLSLSLSIMRNEQNPVFSVFLDQGEQQEGQNWMSPEQNPHYVGNFHFPDGKHSHKLIGPPSQFRFKLNGTLTKLQKRGALHQLPRLSVTLASVAKRIGNPHHPPKEIQLIFHSATIFVSPKKKAHS